MNCIITNASVADLEEIYLLFEEAISFQKRNHYVGWHSYDKEFIQTDIQNKGLFKVMSGGRITGIFSVCFSDSFIWRDMETGEALYLHRVVVNQQARVEKLFGNVLNWAIKVAHEKQLKYIRIDTWAENEKIIAYYKSYGFLFVENYTTANSSELPAQHRNLDVALLQLTLEGAAEEVPSRHQGLPVVKELEKVNIKQELATITNYWNQKVIGEANGQLVKLAKGLGEINWHKHDDQDELFLLQTGHLTIQLRNQHIELYVGDMFIVPKGTEHCPVSHGDSEFLIMGLNITSNEAGGRPGNDPYLIEAG